MWDTQKWSFNFVVFVQTFLYLLLLTAYIYSNWKSNIQIWSTSVSLLCVVMWTSQLFIVYSFHLDLPISWVLAITSIFGVEGTGGLLTPAPFSEWPMVDDDCVYFTECRGLVGKLELLVPTYRLIKLYSNMIQIHVLPYN